MNSNLLIVGDFQRNSVIQSRYTYSSWPKIPVNPQLPSNIDAVVMIAGSVSPVTAKELIEICNQNNIPFAYTDSQLNNLESKLETAQKKIEAALDEEAANNQIEVTHEVKENKMATKKNAQKRAAQKSSKSSKKNQNNEAKETKSETPVIASNPGNAQPSNSSNTTETNKEPVAVNTTAPTADVSSNQNSFSVNMLPGESRADALARTLKEAGGSLPVAGPKEDGRKTGKNTQRKIQKADFVRDLFKKNPGMKTEDVQALIVKEFGRGFTPSEIHKIRREFGVEYAGRGILRNISDKAAAKPPAPVADTPRQAPSTVMNDPRGSIEIGSPPNERVYAAIESLRAELGLVSLHVDENGIDYVAQVKGHINHH